MAITCGKCGAAYIKFHKFCPGCGRKWHPAPDPPILCKKCGHEESWHGARHCTECGARLDQ